MNHGDDQELEVMQSRFKSFDNIHPNDNFIADVLLLNVSRLAVKNACYPYFPFNNQVFTLQA